MVSDNGENGAVEIALKLQDSPYHSSHLKLKDGVVLFVGFKDARYKVDGAISLNTVCAGRHGHSSANSGVPFGSVSLDQRRCGGAQIATKIFLRFPSKLGIRVTDPFHLEFCPLIAAPGTLTEQVLDLPCIIAVDRGSRGGLQTRPNLSGKKGCR